MKQTIYILLILSIITIGCNKTKNKEREQISFDTKFNKIHNSHRDSIIEDTIFDLIFELPEVKERRNYIEKATNGKRHMKLIIPETPKENKSNYYWVKVGEDNGTNFVTHFNFFVYSSNFKIKYFDTVNDTIISLEDWRKELKNAQ